MLLEEPFRKLIRIDKIDAHRGFSNLSSKSSNDSEDGDNEQLEKGKLSDQLRSYYKKHIDPCSSTCYTLLVLELPLSRREGRIFYTHLFEKMCLSFIALPCFLER